MAGEGSTDNELLYIMHQQDDWAVEDLLNKYKPMICGMIFRLGQFENCSVSGDAYKEDLEQESRMMLVSAADSYREDYPCSFKTYLQNCLRKHLLTIYRHSQCSSDAAFYACDSLDIIVGENHATYKAELLDSNDRFFDPVYCFALNEASKQIKHLRRYFTPKEWKILCLSLESTSYQEAAALLNITRKSYGNQLSRVRKKLEYLTRKFSEEA